MLLMAVLVRGQLNAVVVREGCSFNSEDRDWHCQR